MTTPAELASSAARQARRDARIAGIREGVSVDPEPTPDEDHFRRLHELEHRGDSFFSATEPGVDPVQFPPIETPEKPKAKRRSSSKKS